MGFRQTCSLLWLVDEQLLSHVNVAPPDKLFSETVRPKPMRGVGIYSQMTQKLLTSESTFYTIMRRWVSLFLSFPMSLLTHAIFNLWPLLAHSKVRGKLNVVLYPFNGTFSAIQRASISVRIIPQKNYVLKHFCFFVSLWGLRKYG